MDYSYLNQAGFDPSSAMSSLSSAAQAASAAVSQSEANFYSDLGVSGSCPSTAAAAAMMPSNYGSLGKNDYNGWVIERKARVLQKWGNIRVYCLVSINEKVFIGHEVYKENIYSKLGKHKMFYYC